MLGKRICLLVAALSLLLSGCAGKSRVTTNAQTSGDPSTKPSLSASAKPNASSSAVPSLDADGHPIVGGEDPHENSLSNKYSVQSPPSEVFRPADSGDLSTGSGRLQLALKIVPGCAELGRTVLVVLRTKPDVEIGILSNVPKPDGKPSETRGRSGSDGLFEWRFPIPPNIETGSYNLFGAAADDKGADGGRSGTWIFLVEKPGNCS